MNIEYLNEINDLHICTTEILRGNPCHQHLVGSTLPSHNSEVTDHEAALKLFTLTVRLLALTAAMRPPELHEDPGQSFATQSALFLRILEFMESNFSDRGLTATKIADAHGISVRYLYSLFQRADMKVSKWIWERRLKAARKDLLDPSLSHVSVSQIAYRRGFAAPAHFSRVFKLRYEFSPTKLRQIAARQSNF